MSSIKDGKFTAERAVKAAKRLGIIQWFKLSEGRIEKSRGY